jgi:superfamily II DNA or RNA helicase
MSLRDAVPARTINTSSHDIVGDFFMPMLQNATRYDRGVGYFSSGWLRENAKGMATFAENGGQARWITSPILSEKDWEYLQKGDRARDDEFLRERLERDIDNLEKALEEDTLSALAWMVADEVLTFRLVLPREKLDRGEFHDKFGVFEDREGNRVSFNGSYNDSRQGLLNYESISVFRSWDLTNEFVRSHDEKFQRLWKNEDPNVQTYTLPDAAQEKILNLRTRDRPYSDPSRQVHDPESDYEAESKWRHQDKAVKRFLKEERGVLAMATGTGKTRTSLKIAKRLINADKIDTIIVATYGTDLLDQWYPKLRNLTNDVSRNFQVFRHYSRHKEKMAFLLDVEEKILLASRKALPKVLEELPSKAGQRTLLIDDEVHRLGSEGNRKALCGLSSDIRFRLGLSATPERPYDDEGNEFIEEYIGEVPLFTFEVGDAIRRRILCPFDYIPLEYELTEEERQQQRRIHAAAAKQAEQGDPMSEEEKRRKLAKIRKTAEAKIPAFRNYVEANPDVLERCIIFVYKREYGEQVLPIIHEHHPDFHTYYGGDDEEVLKRFENGEVECLLTCEKLNEGIDIPSLENVVLFSSPRARLKTIQRIGRCLRIDPDNPDKVARVVDFVGPNSPSAEDGYTGSDYLRSSFLSELSTVRPENSE